MCYMWYTTTSAQAWCMVRVMNTFVLWEVDTQLHMCYAHIMCRCRYSDSIYNALTGVSVHTHSAAYMHSHS